jgi:phage terminase small subunit
MARPPGFTNKGVTPQQIAFVDALIANGGNRTKTAIAAGYSAKTAAVTCSELNVNPAATAEEANGQTDLHHRRVSEERSGIS